MPSRAQFPGANQYYQVAFHEMAHWTGHSSRLNRDLLNNPFGSPEYAREELRAEIASVLVGAEIGFGHEPSDQNAAYVASWVKVLKEDPMEIIRAAGDAQKITKFIGELTREQTQVKQQEKSVKKQPDEQPQGPEKPFKLKVPVQRRFDSLFPATTPREEFATTLENLGFIVKDEHPVMDGKPHRIQVEGDKRGEKAGFYVGYSDGHPAGYAKNNRSGEETRWKAKGYTLSPEQQATLAAEAAAKLRERAKVLQAKHEAAALRIEKKLETAHSAERVPYLEHKQVLPGRDVYALDKTLLVPGYDASGKVRTAQYINEDGVKRYAKDSQKEGCFHVFNGFEEMSKRPAIVIAEGYATAATISEALDGKAAVVSAFDAGNLPMVASAIQGKFPGKPILIAADDDHGKRTNPGQAFARKAAEAIGAIVISPVFAPGEQAREPARYSDFNDMKVNSRLGMDAVKSQLEAGLDKAMEKRQDKEWEQPVRVLKYEEAER
jgi:phage/plasmid primase-like uncharacterized protein